MKNFAALAVFSILAATSASAGDIALPADGDTYSILVAKAAAHDESVDFHALRQAFLDSKAANRAGEKFETVDKLNKQMFAAARDKNGAADVRAAAEGILSIDYTDLWAHKLLRQACITLKDEACADLHHFVEFGLLNSIIHSGDGKTCATGWEAFQVKEEYFVLAMLGVRPARQALISGGGHQCDAMDGTDESGASVTHFFAIDAMMANEAKAFGGK